tara:strand:+ start:716 stop:979 length:264 start_codon:yes stop_codon:yes gene_type:complete
VKNIIYSLVLLLIPLILTNYCNSFNWGVEDFVIAGLLIFSCLSAVSYIKEKFSNQNKTIAIILVIIFFMLIWIELAVGVFGLPFAGS